MNGFTPTSLLAPDLQTQLQNDQRRLALAQMLKQQSLTQPQMQVVSGHVVPYGIGEGLTNIARALMARKMGANAQQDIANLQQQANEAYGKSLVQQLPGTAENILQNGKGPTVANAAQLNPQAQQLAQSLPEIAKTNPQLANSLVANQWTQELKQPQPYTLTPGAGRFGPDNKLIASMPSSQNQQTGWTFMTSRDGTKSYRVNPNSGEIQVHTDLGWTPDPTADMSNMQKVGNQGNYGSSMNQRFVNRVSGAANEGASALISMSGMSDPNSGIFSSAAMGGAGGKHLIAGILSAEGVKRYNATIAGLAPEIAAAQNQGMVPHDAQIQAVEQALTISPTDNLTTKQYRIALGARFLRNALEISNDLANPQQQQTIKRLIKKLSIFPTPDEIAGNKWNQGVFNQYPGPQDMKTEIPQSQLSDQDLIKKYTQ